MQASWNQWNTPVNSVNNYGATSFTNSFPPVPNASNAAAFPVQSTAPITNAPIGTQFPPNVYGAQQTQSTQQQWQQWEQWHQQYAQWQQQYGDKYQGPVPTPAMVPSAFPAGPPLPPSAPSAQPPPPDSLPPVEKDDSLKRPHEGSSNEDAKKSKTGKGKQETLESLIESEKTFDQQFKSWEASFLQWKEQNVNHPDKTQYKEYEAKCESYREQLLQKREVLRKKRETKEAEVAAAAAAAKEAALATSSAATAQQVGYSSTATTQNTFMPPPNMMYPPMIPNPTANTFVPNYSMYSMPPPMSLPSLNAPPPLGGPIDDDPTKKNSQSLEFLSAASAMSGAKSIPGLDLVGSEKNPATNFAPNIPPTSTLFSAYNRDITKPLHTSEDKPFNFPRPAQQNYGTNSTENRYPYPGGPPNFDNDSRMSHSNRTVPFSQFDRPNQAAPYDRSSQIRDGNRQFDRPNLARDGNAQFDRNNQMRDGNQPFDRPNPMSDNNDRFKNQTSYPSNEYGDRGDYQFRKNEQPDSNYRNNDRNNFGGNSSSFTFNSDKYAKYLEDEYDDSRFRDDDPEDDYSQNKSDYQRDNSYRNSNFSNRQNFRNDSGPQFGRNRGGDRDFGDRNFNRDFNNRDERPSFQDRKKDGPNFGGFSREGDRFGGGRSFDRPPFGKDNTSFGTDTGFGKNAPFGKDSGFGKGATYGKGTFGKDNMDMKEPLNKFDIERNMTKEPVKPVSLLDLPLMKPPEAFDKLQPPPLNSLESFDPKIQPPFLKPPDPFESKSISEVKNGLPPMNEPPPNATNFIDKKNISLGHEQKPFIPVTKPGIPVEQPVVPIEQPLPLEPFVASQILEYNHVCVSSEDNSAFEPIWVFDYSHGKKKTIDAFDLIPKSDVVTEAVSKPESLFKNDNVWQGDPWEEKDTGPSQTPLPERSRNPPFMNKTRNDERNSNTPASLLDRREPLSNKNKDSVNNERNGDKSWLPEKKPPEEKPPTKLIDELLLPPGRDARPAKIVIIMRGPPGSGKTYTAKIIKDKEVEMGGNAPRILSLDDYFAIEDLDSGDLNSSGDKESSASKYKYDADLEPSYLDSLVKSFKKNVIDGFFPFIIVDSVNDKLKKYDEMYNFAKSKGFQVFICEMDRDPSICKKQDIHDRSEEDISKIIKEWEPTPSSQTVLDVQNLLKTSVEKMEVETEEKPTDEQVSKSDKETIDIFKADSEPEDTNAPDLSKTEDQTEPTAEKEAEEYSSYMESKWEKMEQTEEKLARLDGVTRKRSTSFKEWLQLPEERDISWYVPLDAGSTSDASVPKKKRVRWADLEERMAQQKMRKIGFVVGQTDWKRMMDPSFGGNALTQTKYI